MDIGASGRPARSHATDLRAATRLAVEATAAVADLVQDMHLTIAAGAARPLAAIAQLFTAPVYGSVKAIAHLVGAGLDATLAQLASVLGESQPGTQREALLAALNGVLGDVLEERNSPLAIQMSLRRPAAPSGSRALLLIHGSCMSDLQWNRKGHDHGAALADHLGYVPIYVHYNSGLHISTNGRILSDLLERLVAAWPSPLDEISILAHSMGGLVARSACHAAETSGHAWRRKLRKLVFLGTPHHGASLERGGSWAHLLLGVSRYSAPLARLARIRSAGITDLRFGNVLDDDWKERDRFAVAPDPRRRARLPDAVECYAVAASEDGLVSVDSALGRHREPALSLRVPPTHCLVASGMNHVDLLGAELHPAIAAWLR